MPSREQPFMVIFGHTCHTHLPPLSFTFSLLTRYLPRLSAATCPGTSYPVCCLKIGVGTRRGTMWPTQKALWALCEISRCGMQAIVTEMTLNRAI